MSFWDTIGGLFTGDTYFPDNVHREARVTELAGDCRQYAALLAIDAEDFKSKQEVLNSVLEKALGGIANLPDGAKIENVDFGVEKWTVGVSQLIAPLITYPAVSTALTTAATSYLVGTGEIGAAGLVSLVGLPAAFEAAVGVAAGVFAIGAVFGVGAISGAVKRSKLQDAIHEAIPGRVKLYKAHLINHKLLQLIDALIQAVNALAASGAATDIVMEQVRTLVTEARAEIDKTTDSLAIEALHSIDIGRSAWTNEDN